MKECTDRDEGFNLIKTRAIVNRFFNECCLAIEDGGVILEKHGNLQRLAGIMEQRGICPKETAVNYLKVSGGMNWLTGIHFFQLSNGLVGKKKLTTVMEEAIDWIEHVEDCEKTTVA